MFFSSLCVVNIVSFFRCKVAFCDFELIVQQIMRPCFPNRKVSTIRSLKIYTILRNEFFSPEFGVKKRRKKKLCLKFFGTISIN